MTPADEITALERKLAVREKEPGFAENTTLIRERIAELRANTDAGKSQIIIAGSGN